MQQMFIYMTMPDVDVARQIGRTLVSEQLAACVNILPGMESLYHWDGALQHETEFVLVAKTTAARVDALTRRVVDLHPYEVPCIVAWPITQGFTPFLHWIEARTSAP